MNSLEQYLKEFSKENPPSAIANDWEQFGDNILKPLLQLLKEGSSFEKSNAAHVIRQIYFNKKFQDWIVESAVEPLIINLQDPEPKTRGRTALVLADVKDERALMPLIQIAQDSNAYVRYVIAGSLGEFNDPQAIPALEWIRENDVTAQVIIGPRGDFKRMNKDVATDSIKKLKRLS